MKYQASQGTVWQTFVLALLLMMATGFAPAQKTKVVTVRIKDGTWSGTTSLGDEISFEVKDHKVVGLTFPIRHSCKEINVEGSSIQITKFPVPSKISRTTGAFRIPLNGPKLAEYPEARLPLREITMQGRIRADGTASGTLEFAGVCVIPAKITWKATYGENKPPPEEKKTPSEERPSDFYTDRLLGPVLDISNPPLADITKRELSSDFVLEYSNVQKYFSDSLDPISVLENPIYRPWWILRTKKSIHRLGFRSFTKNGALIGGSIAQSFVKEGYIFVAIRGGEAYLALAHQEDMVDCLGVNTEVQFDSANWVPFFGNEFRNGGFQISKSGLAFKNGTQVRKVESQQVYEFDGSAWTKTRRFP